MSSRTGKINAQLGNLPGALPLIQTQIVLINIFCLSLHHRDTTPGNEKTSVMIREAIDLTRNNRIDLESLKSLHQVKTKDLRRNRKYYWGLGHIPWYHDPYSNGHLWKVFICIFHLIKNCENSKKLENLQKFGTCNTVLCKGNANKLHRYTFFVLKDLLCKNGQGFVVKLTQCVDNN